MYAQKIEGDACQGEKLDRAKIDKMSGQLFASPAYQHLLMLFRPAARPAVRAHASNPKWEWRA